MGFRGGTGRSEGRIAPSRSGVATVSTTHGTAMAEIRRPLSPHLQIYRWPISMATSILHRVTGVGLTLGTVGTDLQSGSFRFVFGRPELLDGIGLVAMAMGLFGVAEVIANAARGGAPVARRPRWREMLPTRADWRAASPAMLRGAGLGAGFGALPGTGSSIASFVSYAVEKRVASRTLDHVDWNNSHLIEGDITGEIARLKREAGRNIYVFGSANLLETLLAYKLVDEYRICLAPVICGSGTPLFKHSDSQHHLTLLEARPLATGGVVLRYAMNH